MKATPPGLELGHASPVVLPSCLGQHNETHVTGKGDSAHEGSSHWTRKGLVGAELQVPSTSREWPEQCKMCVASWPGHSPGSRAVLQTESSVLNRHDLGLSPL